MESSKIFIRGKEKRCKILAGSVNGMKCTLMASMQKRKKTESDSNGNEKL